MANFETSKNRESPSLLAKFLAEEEDTNSKSDLDFISLMNKQENETSETHNKYGLNGDNNLAKEDNGKISSAKQNELYVNQSFSFGGIKEPEVDETPKKNNDNYKPFISPATVGHSRKSSLNYTPIKNYIQPPPVSSPNGSVSSSGGHTFRKTHRYKHSSVSINYNELLNITNKIDTEDPFSADVSAENEKLHILVNKYLEFPTLKSLLKSLNRLTYVKVSLSVCLMFLIQTTQEETIYSITIATLLQSHIITFVMKEVIECIKKDNFYPVYNFENPFGFQRLPTIIEYSGLLHVSYKMLNLFFEFLEMILLGNEDGVHGSHTHSGHQHSSSDDNQIVSKVKQSFGIGVLVITGLVSGYLRDWYSMIAVLSGLLLPLDSLVLKILLVCLLSFYLFNKIFIIVNYLLKFLNMSTTCNEKKILVIKQKLSQILMTEMYDLKIASISDDCSIVLVKVDKVINIIDIEVKQKIYTALKSELDCQNIMLTVQL